MSKIKIYSDLSVNRYYTNNINLENYKKAQVKRWSNKKSATREKSVYESASRQILHHIKKNNNTVMCCLGTRNNFERDCFRELLGLDRVFSLDIAEDSGADFVSDFNNLNFDKKIDVIFSNAIDHCINPTHSYLSWHGCLKPGGVMLIDFDHDKPCNDHDCSDFSQNSIELFLNELESLGLIKQLIKPYVSLDREHYTDGYIRTLVRKI